MAQRLGPDRRHGRAGRRAADRCRPRGRRNRRARRWAGRRRLRPDHGLRSAPRCRSSSGLHRRRRQRRAAGHRLRGAERTRGARRPGRHDRQPFAQRHEDQGREAARRGLVRNAVLGARTGPRGRRLGPARTRRRSAAGAAARRRPGPSRSRHRTRPHAEPGRLPVDSRHRPRTGRAGRRRADPARARSGGGCRRPRDLDRAGRPCRLSALRGTGHRRGRSDRADAAVDGPAPGALRYPQPRADRRCDQLRPARTRPADARVRSRSSRRRYPGAPRRSR